jgi:tetratricopeptide (TPR) repeat protein/mono/diheme cytochrome c family protein
MYKQVAHLFAAIALLPAAASGQVTFSKDVAPVVFSKCAQCHHPGGSAPFSLLTYRDARPHATQMALLTKNRVMPPWKVHPSGPKFIGLDLLSDAEIAIIERWVAEGAHEGNRRDLPTTPARTGGWQFGTPDLVVTLSKPYGLAADGPDVSRVFVLPVPVDRVRYVRGIEFRANTPRIHHANIRIDATPASRELDESDPSPGYDGIIMRSAVYPDGHFLGWTPGQAAPLLPPGLAWTLAPHSDLVVQLHLVPSGKPESIQPSIGLYFTDDPPTQTPVMMRLSNQHIDIPAGDRTYIATDSFVLPVDVEVLAVQPHAHYLAREVSGTATLPDGSHRTLISIPDWDLRWQHVYRYQTPVPLPKGTTVAMRYRYDNSAANPRNPAVPPVRVPWGQQSREEMGDLWLQVVTKTSDDRELLDRTFRAKWMATDVVGLESLIRRQPDRASLRDDIAVLYMELNRPAEAVPHFAAALSLKPGSAAAHFNLGTALAGAGRLDEAITHYQHALTLRPAYAIAQNNLGTAFLQLGRPQPALAAFREAAQIDPRLGEAHLNVGLVSRALGDFPEALARFRRVLELNPNWVTAVSSLASLLAAAPEPSIRNPAEAVRLADRAVSLTFRRDANTLDVLAVAHAAAGDFDRAVGIADEALALKPPASLATMIRAHRELFKARRPYISAR